MERSCRYAPTQLRLSCALSLSNVLFGRLSRACSTREHSVSLALARFLHALSPSSTVGKHGRCYAGSWTTTHYHSHYSTINNNNKKPWSEWRARATYSPRLTYAWVGCVCVRNAFLLHVGLITIFKLSSFNMICHWRSKSWQFQIQSVKRN